MHLLATTFDENAPRYCAQCKPGSPKSAVKFSAEMFVKQYSIFCARYFMLVPLRIAQIDW
jgi:hypothetical protein